MSQATTPTSNRATSNRVSGLPYGVWLLTAGMFMTALGFGIVVPTLPAFAARFDVGATASAMVISVFAFVRLAATPAAGRIVGVIGERSTYVWGLLLVGGLTGLCAFAGAYWQLLVFRGLAGIGSTMLTVSAAVLLMGLTPPHQRGRAIGVFNTAGMLGLIGGPLMGGLLYHVDARLPFLAFGVMTVTFAFTSRILLRDVVATTTSTETADRQEALPLSQALRHPTYRAALAANFAVQGWTAGGLQALLPLFVPQVLHGDTTLAGLSLSTIALGTVSMLAISGRCTDRFGRKPVALVGLAISTAAVVTLAMSGSMPVLIVSSLVFGAGAGMLIPPNGAAANDIAGLTATRPAGAGPTSGRRGSLLAGFQMAGDIGWILGPLTLSTVATLLSYRAAFLVSAAVIVLAALAWWTARETASATPLDAD